MRSWRECSDSDRPSAEIRVTIREQIEHGGVLRKRQIQKNICSHVELRTSRTVGGLYKRHANWRSSHYAVSQNIVYTSEPNFLDE